MFSSHLCYNHLGSYFTTGNRDTGWLTFILHRMEVLLMKNQFDFKSEASEIPLTLADGMNGECRIYNYE